LLLCFWTFVIAVLNFVFDRSRLTFSCVTCGVGALVCVGRLILASGWSLWFGVWW